MKKFKLVALVLAVVMLTACFVGCEKKEKVIVNVTVSVIANDEVMFGPVAVTLEGDAENPPTILQCVQEAFILNDVPHENDEMAITSINNLADKEEGEYTYWWDYTINGAAPASGRAGTIAAQEGDVIVYTYTQVLTQELIDAEDAGED